MKLNEYSTDQLIDELNLRLSKDPVYFFNLDKLIELSDLILDYLGENSE